MEVLVLLVFGLALAAAFTLGDRPRIRVMLDHGKVEVQRGRPPVDLVHDLEAVARALPRARGRVELRGRGPGLRIRTRGLDEIAAQRVRNVVLIRRGRL